MDGRWTYSRDDLPPAEEGEGRSGDSLYELIPNTIFIDSMLRVQVLIVKGKKQEYGREAGRRQEGQKTEQKETKATKRTRIVAARERRDPGRGSRNRKRKNLPLFRCANWIVITAFPEYGAAT